MRFITSFTTAMTALALAVAATTASAAPPPPNRTIAMANAQQLANFRLTDGFLRKDLAYSLDQARHPCQHSAKPGFVMLEELGSLPMNQIIARFDAAPGVHADLAKHGLTAHDAVLGGLMMFVVGMDHMSQSPQGKRMGMTSSDHLPDTAAMRANHAFYNAHWPEIQAHTQQMQTIAAQQVKANGGKMPACLKQQLQGL